MVCPNTRVDGIDGGGWPFPCATERSIHKMGLSPLSLYTLVLLSAVAHAAWNALVKSADDRPLMMGAIRAVGLTYGLVMLPQYEVRKMMIAVEAEHASPCLLRWWG